MWNLVRLYLQSQVRLRTRGFASNIELCSYTLTLPHARTGSIAVENWDLYSTCLSRGRHHTAQMGSKTLVAFDFDHTLIDDNSDIYLSKLAPNGVIPPQIKQKYSSKGWTNYMGAIFKYFHENGIEKATILDCMREIPFTNGMPELLRHLAENECETIIISDSNSVFIQCILEHNSLQDTVTEVFTNPASFDGAGCLMIKFYHTQDWCDLSTVNLCKGTILKDYIQKREKEGMTFDHIYFIGDGSNDLCPCLSLRESDYACPRVNFALWKKLQIANAADSKEVKNLGIKAKVVPWEDGWKLLDEFKGNIS